MGKLRISEQALQELAKTITRVEVDLAITASGCRSDGEFFNLAAARAGETVLEKFVLIDELRSFGLLRKGESPEDYEIPEYVRLFAALIVSGEDPRADFKAISLALKAKTPRPVLNGKTARL